MGKRSLEDPAGELAPSGSGTDDSNTMAQDENRGSDFIEEQANGSIPPRTHSEPPAKKHLKAQDVQIVWETAELFKSNIFKLQIDELVKEVKLKESHIARAEQVLHRLYDCILQVPVALDLTLEEAERAVKSRVAIPFPEPKPANASYRFSYLPPENVSLVGSFGLKLGIAQAHGLSIDIALIMPKSLFHEKDYLNYRAFYKRSFYIAYLADQLILITKRNNLPVKISYMYLNDDVLCPVLQLESIKTDNDEDLSFHKTKLTINILVGLPFGVFDAKKLLPDKNCVRVQSDDEELPPTPYYNSLILSLATYDYYLKFLYANKKSAEAFKDACTLGRLWLQQRGFGSSISKGGFGHFEFAILLSALLSGGGSTGNKILLQGFSSYQLFKGLVKYLATMDLTSGYISFSSQLGEPSTCVYNAQGFNTPTIFDKNAKLNLLWKMTNSSYVELRLHAINTLGLLNDVVFDRFDAIFLHKVSSDTLKYDVTYTLEIPDDMHQDYTALEKIKFITFDNYLRNKLYTILKTALGERVTCILLRNKKTINTFRLNKRAIQPYSKAYTIGLQLNAEECDKLVTKGPNDTEDEQAANFRSFWGSKGTLRRFKDGTIQHCVVWEVQPLQPIVSQIIHYSLGMHFHPLVSQYLSSNIADFHALLPAPLHNAQLAPNSATNFSLLKNSYDSLTKILFNLQLPLGVKLFLAASAGLRKTSMLQPVAFAVSSPDFWNDVVLQFETSARWPDEIKTLEKTKTAFLLRISEVLSKETSYTSYLCRDDSIPFNEDVTTLNILTPDGFGFRVRVLTEKDGILYLRAVANAGKEKQFVQEAYFKFNQRYLGAVKHTRNIGILSTGLPYFSPTVRLFKKWLDAHGLLCHFSDELVELIAMKPFLDPAAYTVPNSVCKGFLQILNFIATWNWKDDPLILDTVKKLDEDADELDTKLSDKLGVQDYHLIQENFEKIRKSDPVGVKTQFFVGSRGDPSGILWSNKLTLPIASRLTGLARVAIQHVKEHGMTKAGLDLFFTPAFADFDFVIKLKPNDLLQTSGVQITAQYKNLNPDQTTFPRNITSKYDLTVPFVDFLRKWFGNEILFFTRLCPAAFGEKDNFVCGVFIPSAISKQKFRVTLGLDVKPTGENGEVVVDKQDILDQIKILGGDLIESMTTGKTTK